MSRGLEYVIMLFLVGSFLIMLTWSGNGRYQVQGQRILIDTRNGDVWTLSTSGKQLIGDYNPNIGKLDPRIFQKDLQRIVDDINKDSDKVKE